MEALQKLIKEKRPKLSDSSLMTYCRNLKSLFKDIFKDKELDHTLFIKDQPEVLAHLSTVKFNTRKALLSALVSFTEGNVQKVYREHMMKDIETYNTEQKTHKMSDIQKENWIPWAEIEERLVSLKKEVEHFWKAEKPSPMDLAQLQRYVMLACYVLQPPRRAMDFCKMKCRNYVKNKDNFYENGKFVFVQYKTAKQHGVQIMEAPPALKAILKKWIAFHNNDHMFFNYYGEELSSSELGKVLNSCFTPKKIAVNMLRHIYITEKASPLINQLETVAAEMGHTTETQKMYVKKK
jgi:integrase